MSDVGETPIINIMTNAIRKALRPLIRDYGEILHLQSSFKGTNDFAEKTYNRVNEIIFNDLSESKPDVRIYNNTMVQDDDDCDYDFHVVVE